MQAREQNWPFEDALLPPECSLLMSAQHLIRCMQQHLRRNAEYVGALRAIFDDAKVNWQTAELGKVDVGGGGTIAYIMSLYGMEVIDSGVPVLSMHAPWEVTSKADVYEAKKAYVAFLKNA